MKTFKDFLNESNEKYKVSFRKSGSIDSKTIFTGSKEAVIDYFKSNFSDFKIYDDFGSSFGNGDGLYAAKIAGKGSGEVSILPIN